MLAYHKCHNGYQLDCLNYIELQTNVHKSIYFFMTCIVSLNVNEVRNNKTKTEIMHIWCKKQNVGSVCSLPYSIKHCRNFKRKNDEHQLWCEVDYIFKCIIVTRF